MNRELQDGGAKFTGHFSDDEKGFFPASSLICWYLSWSAKRKGGERFGRNTLWPNSIISKRRSLCYTLKSQVIAFDSPWTGKNSVRFKLIRIILNSCRNWDNFSPSNFKYCKLWRRKCKFQEPSMRSSARIMYQRGSPGSYPDPVILLNSVITVVLLIFKMTCFFWPLAFWGKANKGNYMYWHFVQLGVGIKTCNIFLSI